MGQRRAKVRMEFPLQPNQRTIELSNPWLIVCENEPGPGMKTIITMPQGSTYEQYGMLIADVIRHTARAFNIDEDAVREWVDMEMDRPTTPIESGSVH